MSLARAAARQLAFATSNSWQAVSVRGMAGEGLKGFSEHEKTIEASL